MVGESSLPRISILVVDEKAAKVSSTIMQEMS